MVKSTILGGAMISTLAHNAIDVGSISTLGTIFPIVILHDTDAMTVVLYNVHAAGLCNLPCLRIFQCIADMYVIVSITCPYKRFTNPGGRV